MTSEFTRVHPNYSVLAILLVGILGVFVTIGITRLSFGMVVPLLQQNPEITSTVIGFIGTANFIGYFIGALLAHMFNQRYALRPLIFAVFAVEAVFMLIMSIVDSYLLLALCFALVGVASAIGYMSIMSYVAHTIAPSLKGRALGAAISGNSVGIIISGLSVYGLGSLGEYSFSSNYWVFIVCMCVSIIIIMLRIIPTQSVHNPATTALSTRAIITSRNFIKMASIYLLFGISYTLFLTYFVSHIIEKFTIDIQISSYFWLVLGGISLASGPLFGLIADKYSTYTALAITYVLLAISAMSIVIGTEQYVIVLSALLFGIAVWSTPSLMFLLSTTYFGKANTTKATALVTVAFGLGQIIGPITGGAMYDIFAGYDLAFTFVGMLCILCAGMSVVFNRQLKYATRAK